MRGTPEVWKPRENLENPLEFLKRERESLLRACIVIFKSQQFEAKSNYREPIEQHMKTYCGALYKLMARM